MNMGHPDPSRWKAHIVKQRRIAENTAEISLWIDGPAFEFKAGQYVKISIPRLLLADPKGNSRDFSISSMPSQKNLITIAFRISDSVFKQDLIHEPDSSPVEIQGPLGIFTLPEKGEEPVVFIAGGIGITPFLSIIRHATEKKLPRAITLLYANSSPESAAYLPELEALEQKNKHFTLTKIFGVLDDESIRHYARNNENAGWYIAGPPGMVFSSRNALLHMRIPEEKIIIEEFSGYDMGRKTEPTAEGKNDEKEEAPSPLDIKNLSQNSLPSILQALNAAAIVSVTDLKGTITYANDKFLEISKYRRQELIGNNHRVLKSGFHPQSFYDDMWHEYLLKGKVWRGEIKNRAKDGSFYWVDSSITPILDAHNKIIGYIGIRFPITEQKRLEELRTSELSEAQDTQKAILNILEDEKKLEEALRKEKAQLAITISSMGDGLIVVDALQNVMLANPMAEKIMGMPKEKMLGQNIRSITTVFHKDLELPAHERPLAQVMETKSSLSLSISDNYYYQTSSRKKFPISASITPLIMSDGSLEGAVIVFNDVTDEKKLEETKETFVSIASHQLRTPLTSIRWYTEMLDAGDAGELNENQKAFLSNIYSGVLRLAETLDMLLSLTRVESGRVKVETTDIDLVEFTKAIAKELAPYSTAKNLALDVLLENTQSARVKMDSSMLRQVVMNILSNAIRYTNNKTAITITIKPEEDHWLFAVRDQGIGIPRDSKEKVFEKFYRADNAVSLVPDGNGLGLALVKDLVEIWEGKIWFESEENKGTTFYFTIPLAGMKENKNGTSLA